MKFLLPQLSEIPPLYWIICAAAVLIVIILIIIIAVTVSKKKAKNKAASAAEQEVAVASAARVADNPKEDNEVTADEKPAEDVKADKNTAKTSVGAEKTEVKKSETIEAKPDKNTNTEEKKSVSKPVAKSASKSSASSEKPAAKTAEKKSTAKPAIKPAAKDDNKTYHISKRKDDGKWQVKAAGGAKAIKLFDTQKEAIEFAKTLADNQDARIMIHKEDGSFRKLTY